MKRSALALLAAAVVAGGAWAQAPAARPTIPQVCTNCHKPAAGQMQGYFENVSFKSQAIQLKIDNVTEIVKFDPKTIKVIDAGDNKKPEALYDIKRGHEARIELVEKDGAKWATLISFKGPIKIAPEKLINYAEVAKLVGAPPDKAVYTLVDSRPLPRFQEGTIPTAINLPYPAFDKLLDRLPQSKSSLLVFFCQGITCMMSPNSLRRAEALGYTNVKVYREGWPEWTTKNWGVLAPQFLKEAWIDKDIPHVLIDARPAADIARSGFIKGAVSITPEQIKGALKGFPGKKLNAPIMVYDAHSGEDAVKVAKAIVAAGYPFVTVVTGGLASWTAAGFPLTQGAAATKVAYAPKPRPGSIPDAEFLKLVDKTPADVLILDVRMQDEANAGMIKGAKLIPDEELAARIKELPKDKRIITHCSTGVRAEMAYHKLKEAGYNAGFVYATVDVAKDGKVKLTAN